MSVFPAASGDREIRPGLYPLRPLGIGEILSVAVRVAWRHLPLLAPVALLSGLLSAAANVGVLAAFGDLRTFVDGSWQLTPSRSDQAWLDSAGRMLGHLLLALLASLTVSWLFSPLTAGMAAACATGSATSAKPQLAAGLARLRGRWGGLVVVSVLTGLSISGATLLLVVPGVLLMIAWLPAGPIAAVEGGRPMQVLRRAGDLTAGFRPRLFGITMVAGLFAVLVGVAVTTVVNGILGQPVAIGSYLASVAISAVLQTPVVAWGATVTAMLYVDLRMRREGLAQALRASAFSR